MSAYEIAAIQELGVHVVMKHYALNDSEQDRIGLGVWLNEQAAREVYLKAYQAPFEEGNANGVMAAYTRFGTTWSGGHYGLMTGILRNEWGCDGLNITDNVLTTYVNGVDGILAGVSTFDAMLPYVTNQLPKYKNDAVIVNAMREACHYNLYAIANSIGMNGVGENTTIKVHPIGLVTGLRVAVGAFAVLFIGSLVMWIRNRRRFKASETYVSYQAYLQSLKEEKAEKAAE
jgi:beta-glucosidase